MKTLAIEILDGRLTAWYNRKWMEHFLSEFTPEEREELMKDVSDIKISVIRNAVTMMLPGSCSAILSRPGAISDE
jgi:hypothetical protein